MLAGLSILTARLKHSHIKHLVALLKRAKEVGVPEVFIHFFGDGRDTDPKSGAGHLRDLLKQTQELGVGQIATIVGRYYIMDRDKRWERVEIGMRGVVLGEGEDSTDPVKTIEERYSKNETDEFLKPIIVGDQDRRVKGELLLLLLLLLLVILPTMIIVKMAPSNDCTQPTIRSSSSTTDQIGFEKLPSCSETWTDRRDQSSSIPRTSTSPP